MRLRLVASAVLCAGLIVCTGVPAAAAEDPAPNYLALGDSVAFGYREMLPLTDYLDASQFVGYPEELARLLGLHLTNAACPGETSGSFISASAADNGCRLYRAHFPLHTPYTDTQLAFAVAYLRSHPGIQLVTLDLGANDLFLLKNACSGSVQCVLNGLPTLLATVAGNLDVIYDALRSQAGYHGQIVALTYYVTDLRDTPQLESVGALDLAIARETLRHGGRVADGLGAFAAASITSGGDACAAGLLNRLPSGGCDIHPSRKGHDVLARAIRAVLR